MEYKNHKHEGRSTNEHKHKKPQFNTVKYE